MASLSTGKSVGTTDRPTSQRVLGGIAMDATPGALAQREIAAPALQPAAAPVNTFQQVGAPTLGGPVRMFAPPDLPQPNQDLAALAKSLSGFSTTLEQVGKTALDIQKLQDEQAKKQGQAIAIQLASKYPGQQFAEVRDLIAKRVQAGDVAAQADYQLLQSKNPLTMRYAQSFLEEQVALSDLTTAPSRWRSIQDIPGVMTDANGNPTSLPKEALQPGDTRLQQQMMRLVRLPSDPEAAARVLPQVNALYRELTNQQTSEHADWKKRYFISAVGDYATSVVDSSMPEAEAAAAISDRLLDARRVLGPKEYGDVVQAIQTRLVSAAESASYQADGSINTEKGSAAVGRAVRLQTAIVAGPNGETLLSRMDAQGGLTGQLTLLKRGLEGVKSIKGLADDFAKFRGEKIGPEISAQFDILNPNVVGPQREANVSAARLAVTRIPDPVARQEASNQLERDISAMERGVVEYRRDTLQREVYALMQSGVDPQQKLNRLYELGQSGEVDPAFINAQIDRAERERSALNRPSQNAVDNRLKELLKQEMDFLNQAGPKTGRGISQEESEYLNNKKAMVQSQLNEIRRQGYASGKTNEQIMNEQNQYLDRVGQELTTRMQRIAPVQVAPTVPNPQQYYDSRGGFLGLGRGGRSPIAGQLNRAVEGGIVMPEAKYKEALEAWVEKNTLPAWARQIIKDAGYGQKADEFFRKQWNNLYPGAPFPAEFEQRMNALKGVKVSYTPPAGGSNGFAMVNPSAATATRLASFAQNMLNSVFTPPAAAADMPLATVRPMRSTGLVAGSGSINANAKAWLAAISGQGFEGAGYNTYYGGGTFDNRRGHPMRVVRPQGGIPSSAAGRYQFMPDTWTGLHGGKNPPMTPERQDAAAYKLALDADVDLNTAKPTLANVRKLAPIWAALPVSAAGGSGYYKGQGGAGLRRFQQLWQQELRRYSGQ